MWKWYLAAVAALVLVAAPFLFSAPAPRPEPGQPWRLPLITGERYEFNFGSGHSVGEVAEYPADDWVRISYPVGVRQEGRWVRETQEEWVNLRSVNTIQLVKVE
jgi:hypothetical protein